MKVLDTKLVKFVMVGCLNTVLGLALMFLFYDWGGMGYWGSSSLSFFLASTVSFFLNKSFTFNNRDAVFGSALKFSLTIAICYLIAYSMAKPLVVWLLDLLKIGFLAGYAERIAMVTGMVVFTFLNYLGQRFFAFRNSSSGVSRSL